MGELLVAVLFSASMKFLLTPAFLACAMWLAYVMPLLIDFEASPALVTKKAQERLHINAMNAVRSEVIESENESKLSSEPSTTNSQPAAEADSPDCESAS